MKTTLNSVMTLRQVKHVATKIGKQQMGRDKAMILLIMDTWNNMKECIVSQEVFFFNNYYSGLWLVFIRNDPKEEIETSYNSYFMCLNLIQFSNSCDWHSLIVLTLCWTESSHLVVTLHLKECYVLYQLCNHENLLHCINRYCFVKIDKLYIGKMKNQLSFIFLL